VQIGEILRRQRRKGRHSWLRDGKYTEEVLTSGERPGVLPQIHFSENQPNLRS
jgi:hypothetical protein